MARYELLQRIGVGGMAEIFRGRATADEGFEKPVAIKRILPHISQDRRFVELLIAEAKTLAGLRHRNIVQVYDVGQGDDGTYFLVMEFVDGLDLRDLTAQRHKSRARLPIGLSLYIAAEICDALEHAHRAKSSDGEEIGLVHRDVSPSNVLLSKSGEVKLTDFGLAKRMEEMTTHGAVHGRFAYISPEQANNQRVDGRSDLHSLGIVLFELLTGEPLFSALPDFEALDAVREHRIPRLRDADASLDLALENLIMPALAANPDERYQTSSAFAAKLREYRYGMVSSGGDPAQELAKTVRAARPRQSQEIDASNPEAELTIVRLLSEVELAAAARAGKAGTDSARIDSIVGDDDLTIASMTAAPEPSRRSGADSRQIGDREGELTVLERPVRAAQRAKLRAAGKGRGRLGSAIDPDADTELAVLTSALDASAGPEGAVSESYFDGELPTRVQNRTRRAGAAAATSRRRKPRRQPPPPRRDPTSDDEQNATVPRAEPVGVVAPVSLRPDPAVASSAALPIEPPYPHVAPRAHFFDGADGGLLFGVPREKAYWLIAAGVGLLLLVIVAVAAAGSSGGDAAPGAVPDAGAVPTLEGSKE